MKPLNLILPLFFLCSMLPKVNAQTISKADSLYKLGETTVPRRYRNLPRREPYIALALSLIPAGGQLYNRQYIKTALILGAEASSVIVVSTSHDSKAIITASQALSILAFAATYVYGLVDAPLSAAHLNHKYHLGIGKNKLSLNSIQLSPALVSSAPGFAGNNTVFGFKLTVR